MKRLIQKITSYLALAALVVPMVTLAMPTGAHAAAPAAPINGMPANGDVEIVSTPTLMAPFVKVNVADVQQASRWQIDDESNFQTTVWDFTGGATDNTIVPLGELTDNNQYWWRVEYKHSVDGWSSWSVPTQFAVNLANEATAKPTNLSPSNGLLTTITSPTLTASVAIDVDPYAAHVASQWVVDNNGDFSSPEWTKTTTSGTTEIKVNKQLSDGLYYWHVRYQDGEGAWSRYSDVTCFTIDTTAAGYTVGANPDGATVANDSTVVFEGTAEQSASVKLIVKDEGTDVVVKESGPFTRDSENWRFDILASEIGAGFHDAYIEITDSAGNVTYQKIAHFGVASPVVKATYRTTGTYAESKGSTVAGTNGSVSSTTGKTSDKAKEELKDDVEDTAEGIIKAAEVESEDGTNPWQTVVTVIAILIIAIGVGTAGYYGYEWWATRGAVALGTSGPAESWDKPASKKKTVKKTVAKKKSTVKKSGRRSSSRW